MRISIIGAGNVATQLALRLRACGHEIVQVFSRQMPHAELLAKQVDALAINDLRLLDESAALLILAIKDDAIAQVSAALPSFGGIVAHTSGSVPRTALAQARQAVFYPLQTLSKDKPADFQRVPLCIDAAQPADADALETLALSIAPKAYRISDEQRAILHVAAVFVNNFTNYLYRMGEMICEREQVPFDILKPLILETADKVQRLSPLEAQTGPARRRDGGTIDKHLAYLEQWPAHRQIYEVISGLIRDGIS